MDIKQNKDKNSSRRKWKMRIRTKRKKYYEAFLYNYGYCIYNGQLHNQGATIRAHIAGL